MNQFLINPDPLSLVWGAQSYWVLAIELVPWRPSKNSRHKPIGTQYKLPIKSIHMGIMRHAMIPGESPRASGLHGQVAMTMSGLGLRS